MEEENYITTTIARYVFIALSQLKSTDVNMNGRKTITWRLLLPDVYLLPSLTHDTGNDTSRFKLICLYSVEVNAILGLLDDPKKILLSLELM